MLRPFYIGWLILCWCFVVHFQRNQNLFSDASTTTLTLLASSPINTSSGVVGSLQCTKNSDESYAICASKSNTAIKYNLHPFSFAAKGPDQGNYMWSCDLFEFTSQSNSRAVCAKSGNPAGEVYFHNVTDMINVTNVTIGVTGNYPHVIIDTPNQIAYVSNNNDPPAIYKITNVGSANPNFAATLPTAGDVYPAAMLIIDGFLFVHFSMAPARLARIAISTFTWSQTVVFSSGENSGDYDNLANDTHYIYDLTQNGILVRITYNNTNISRFDSLNTGFGTTTSLAISWDSSFLLLVADYSGIVAVNTSSFSVDGRALLPNPTTSGYVDAVGRPIILSKDTTTNKYPVYAFSSSNDKLFNVSAFRVPFREAYPTIYPLPSSPIKTSSGVSGSLQCTKDSDESYAVCASFSDTAIKYNLQPFSFAAKGPNLREYQGLHLTSCDLYETSSQSTSRAICVRGYDYVATFFVYFHRVSDMTTVTNTSIGGSGRSPHIIVDTPNQVAYVSNDYFSPSITKITNIGSSAPLNAATLSTFGSGDLYPAAMLVIDGFLYAHFSMNPSRLVRINISTFTWNQTITFATEANSGDYDNLANDDNYIYDLTSGGILIRITYKNNNFSYFDNLTTAFGTTTSLAISPDKQTLFVVSFGNSVLRMVNTSSFSMFGNIAAVPSGTGRPIITSWCNVFCFSNSSAQVYAFRFNASLCHRTPTAVRSLSLSMEATVSVLYGNCSMLMNSAQCATNSSCSWNSNTSVCSVTYNYTTTTAPANTTTTAVPTNTTAAPANTSTTAVPTNTTTTTVAPTTTIPTTTTIPLTITTLTTLPNTTANTTSTTTSTTPITTTTSTTTTTTTTTTTQTSLAPVTQVTYAPLPAVLNESVIQVVTSNVPPDSPLVNVSTADNLENISEIMAAVQAQQMQQATTVAGLSTSEPFVIPSMKFFVPYQGLGGFIVLPTQACKYNSKLDFLVDSAATSVQIVAISSGSTADFTYAVKNCVAFNPSQATIERNISSQKFLGVQILSGSAQATTAMALNSLIFNRGPTSNLFTRNCSTNVPRGSRFTANLGFVFTHALGLPLTISATASDLFPLPATIRSTQNASGFVTVRGTITDTEPLEILLIATDSLTPAVQAICTITPVFITLRLKNPMVIPYEIHAGIDFSFYIPSDMFESSSPFWIDYVTQKNGLPLPGGLSFQKPWSIAGRMPAVGLFNWTAFAADDFNEARGYILINSTNSAPRVAVSEPHDLGLAFAARDMSLEIDLSVLFVDSDNDALKFYMNTTELARIPWLRANVAPGGFTKTPQKLTLTGSVPRTARGTNFTLQLYCSDGYNETLLVTVLRIAQGAAPIQIKALPSYTIAPEDVLSEQLAMGDYFVAPDGDQMIVTYTLQPVVAWVTITNSPGANGAPPTLAVAASVSQFADTEAFVLVTVSNALGDSVNATVSIFVRQTQWQKLQAVAIALSAAIGVLTTVLGTIVYWPHMVNAVRGRRLVKKCPLHHTTPRFHFPEETERFECSIRGDLTMCGHDVYKGAECISHYLYNYLSQKPTPNSGPPDWLSVRDRYIVLTLPPPPEDDVFIKVVLCRFWKKQGVLIQEFEVDFDECYKGYVYDKDQIEKNEMLRGDKSIERGALPPSFPVPSNTKVNIALELEVAEAKINQELAFARLHQELGKRDQEMVEMRKMMKEILGRDGEVRPQNPLFSDDDFTLSQRRNTNMFAPSAKGANFNVSIPDWDDEL